MVRCNLSVLLAEQNIKITKVSNDTGISRTTLTSLSNNYSQGIQFDTLNTLCTYLNVKPDELIAYIPIDINIIGVTVHIADISNVLFGEDDAIDCSEYCIIDIELIENNQKYTYQLNCPVFTQKDNMQSVDVISIIIDITVNPECITPNSYLFNILNQLPRPFLTDIEASIRKSIFDFFIGGIPEKDIHIAWNNNT